jgi:hypothetical protein
MTKRNMNKEENTYKKQNSKQNKIILGKSVSITEAETLHTAKLKIVCDKTAESL